MIKRKRQQVILFPEKKQLKVKEGTNLLHLLSRQNYSVPGACGGMGICGKCRILLRKGARVPTEPERMHLTEEELKTGWRLACMQSVDRNIVLEVPKPEEATLAKELMREMVQVPLDSRIEKTYLELSKPSRDDQRPDTVRLQEESPEGQLIFPIEVLRKAPDLLRKNNFQVTVIHVGNHVLDLEPGDMAGAKYGVAIDIGTSTLGGYLLSLDTGEEIVLRSRMNPQHNFGDDVISRISYVRKHGEKGLRELRKVATSEINEMIKQLCRVAKVSPLHIYKATVVGNPTMIHLFTGMDPSNIDRSPFTPVLRDSLRLLASETGLDINPRGQVYILPAISGYVGADITAGILCMGLHKSEPIQLLVDIGTNAEIVLGNKDHLLACSTPAGPALEGARINYGMNAFPGAIAHVVLNGDLKVETIGNKAAKGICGSGLIDLVAELNRVGLLSDKGKFQKQTGLPVSERIHSGKNGQLQFLVSNEGDPIYLTQKDVRELQLAKAAIYSGIEIMLHELRATLDDVGTVYLAGAFGNYIRRESALQVGMLPDFPLTKIRPVGNTAGHGAKLCLLNEGEFEKVQNLVTKVQYLELSYRKDFGSVFMNSMHFPSKKYEY